MKLIEKVLENISDNDIQTIATKCHINEGQVEQILQSITPGILSAFKAKIVTNLDAGTTNTLVDILSAPSTETLFSYNQEALDTLTSRVSALTEFSKEQIDKFLPIFLPVIIKGIADMLQSMTGTALFETGSQMLNNFFSSTPDNNSSYENAIDAANKFLNSVFGKNVVAAPNSSDIAEENGQILQHILEVFERNNDGSMMDDIFNMLIKDKL